MIIIIAVQIHFRQDVYKSGTIDVNIHSFLFQKQCQRRRPAHCISRVEEGASRKHRPDSEAVPRR